MVRSAIAVVALLFIVLQVSHAQPEPISREAVKQLTATVEAVDPESRTLVLRGENDRMLVVAGPGVRNFERIEEGDRVVASYRVAIAAQVKPKGEGARGVDEVTSARAPVGDRPGVGKAAVVATTVEIESVDTSFDTVTFTREDGIKRTVAVEDPDAQAFIRELKRGDEVEVTYTEAIAVNVQPAR